MEEHAHHWMLEEVRPATPSVKGICRVCGEEKDFPATEDDVSRSYSFGGHHRRQRKKTLRSLSSSDA